MDGWKTMLAIHNLGLVFIGLWILGSVRKEGLWSNILLFFNWCVAFYATWCFWQPALKGVLSLVKPDPGSELLILALGMTVIWVIFLAFLAGLRAATDSLSKVKVAFHPLVDKIGTFIFMFMLIGSIRYSALPMQMLLELGKLVSSVDQLSS